MFELFLIVICVLYLALFGASLVRKNKYQIGVIKALGGKTNHIARIFITQLVFVGLMIFVLAGLSIFIAIDFANQLLISSFGEYFGMHFFSVN